jgi:hypothetical protein
MTYLEDKTSPAFLGSPTAPTPPVGDNSTRLATTAFVKSQGYASGTTCWSLSGNAGTTASNFVGTTDAQPIRFRVNNVEQGWLDTNGALRLGNPTVAGISGSERLILNDATGNFSDYSFAVAGNGWPVINLGSSNGTPTARTASAAGGNLGTYNWWGYDGAAWLSVAQFNVKTISVASGSIPAQGVWSINGVTVMTMTSSLINFPVSATGVTPATADNTTKIATTAFVKAQGYLTANQSITLTGDASGTGTTSIPVVLANTGVAPGNYNKVTVDSKGRVVSANLMTTLSTLGITDGVATALLGAVNGVATLDATGHVPLAQLPINGTTGQIAFGNATGTGLISSSSFTWDGTNGLTAAGNATFGGTGIFSGDLTIGGKLKLPAIADPAAAPAGSGYLYAKSVAGRVVPKWIGPAGIDEILQAHIGQDKISVWSPPGNAATVSNLFGGALAFTAVGTATARNVATTNMATRTKRLGYVSATAVGSLTSIRTGVAQYTLGVPGTPNMGGFFLIIRFVPSNASNETTERFFAGVWATTSAPTNVEPSTQTNCIGVAQLSSSTNLQIVYGGSVAQAAIDLGTNFPGNTLSTDLYELILFAPPNSNNTVYYKVSRLNTSFVAEGTLTAATPGTQLPLNTTLLSGPVIWKTNNSQSGAVAFDLVGAYIGTDQ